MPRLRSWKNSTDTIIGLMHRSGWEYQEYKHVTLGSNLFVSFSRRDWHGAKLKQPLSVTRSGPPQNRPHLVRDAGREALALYQEFAIAPGEYHNPRTKELDWGVME